MHCSLYAAGLCASCQWISQPYSQQIQNKQQHLQQLLTGISIDKWMPPVSSNEQAFRNKAKMVVSGSVERPILGLPITVHHDAVDLCDCPLYPLTIRHLFPTLKRFIAKAGLTPYNVARKRGELKHILLSQSRFSGEILLRFVLRSEAKLPQLRQALPWIQRQHPEIRAISANIQPVHMAILEGTTEIALTDVKMVEERFNQIPLYIRPQSFFQTNPDVAEKLYATARRWTEKLPISELWDLFCGVGGFGLHCATSTRVLTGIEISAEAIDCAKLSAKALGLEQVQFQALDSTQFATASGHRPQLVIVNPPRRGIGRELCLYLEEIAPEYLVYSSCNPDSMVKDLALLTSYQIQQVQLFDMFPHTSHYEVLTLLKRI